MIGEILLYTLLGAAAAGAVVAIVVHVRGKIKRKTLKKQAHKKRWDGAIIAAIDRCMNIVTIEDLETDRQIEVHGDDVSYKLDVGDVIYV